MSKNSTPPIGMALWLLKGPLPVRVQWLLQHEFTGVSLLQDATAADPGECREAAAAIREARMNLTCHGNVQQALNAAGKLDLGFLERLLENVLWWHEHAGGMKSVCYDPVYWPNTSGARQFAWELNQQIAAVTLARLRNSGIRSGIENIFDSAAAFASLAAFQRFYDKCADASFGMLLDLGHANIHVHSDQVANETEIGGYLQKIPFEILEVHITDNRGVQDEHKQAGYGNLDLDAALRALKRRGFARQLTIEVCVDILSQKYAADLDNAQETDPILVTRDRIRESWQRAS